MYEVFDPMTTVVVWRTDNAEAAQACATREGLDWTLAGEGYVDFPAGAELMTPSGTGVVRRAEGEKRVVEVYRKAGPGYYGSRFTVAELRALNPEATK